MRPSPNSGGTVNMANGFATAYAILQSVNVSLGLATLPCAIPARWLRGLFAGSGSLSALVNRGDAGDVTLAAVIGYAGFGVFADMETAARFMERWREDAQGLASLGRVLDSQIGAFEQAKRRLSAIRNSLKDELAMGGCEANPLDDILGLAR